MLSLRHVRCDGNFRHMDYAIPGGLAARVTDVLIRLAVAGSRELQQTLAKSVPVRRYCLLDVLHVMLTEVLHPPRDTGAVAWRQQRMHVIGHQHAGMRRHAEPTQALTRSSAVMRCLTR